MGALLPWATFVLVLAAEGNFVAGAAGIGLLVIALPSLIPIVSAPPGVARAVTVVALTGAAFYAGNFINTSEGSTAALAVIVIPTTAVVLTVVIWVGEGLIRSRRPDNDPADPPIRIGSFIAARPNARFAAWFIDASLLFVVLVVPLTRLSHAHQETTAFVIGAVVSVAYFAAQVAATGMTLGHRVLGLRVVNVDSGAPPGPFAAILRSAVIALESALALTVFGGLFALADFCVTSTTGRSVPDVILRTAVVRR